MEHSPWGHKESDVTEVSNTQSDQDEDAENIESRRGSLGAP